MPLESRFTGREEKRVRVKMEVKLVSAEDANAERREKAIVDNISALGARAYASNPWQLGEQVEVTPPAGETPQRAEVVLLPKASQWQIRDRTKIPP